TGLSKWHCAIGSIRYDALGEGATPGTLVYIKSSLTGNEASDVLSYRAQELAFPHQSTSDQWFDESQFESYRKLGYHAGCTTFEVVVRQHLVPAKGRPDIVDFLRVRAAIHHHDHRIF